jgi:hypothetical protein
MGVLGSDLKAGDAADEDRADEVSIDVLAGGVGAAAD